MRKGLVWLLIGLLVVPGGWAEGQAAAPNARETPQTEGGVAVDVYANKWGVIPRWSSSPVLDGVLDEAAWNGAALLDDFRTAYFNETAEGDIAYKVGFDGTNLYIGGTFDTAVKEKLERVEILLSPQSSGERHVVAAVPITPSGRTIATDWNVGHEQAKENPQRVTLPASAWSYETGEANGRFTLEASIPLSALGASSAAPGSEWRMNIMHLHQLNTAPLASWVPIRTASFWDRGGSVRVPGNVVDEGRLGSLYLEQAPSGTPWELPAAELSYLGFAEKRLSFDGTALDLDDAVLDLQWKGPTEDWLPLDDVQTSLDGARVQLTFAHPQPIRDGLYQLRLLAEDGSEVRLAQLVFDRKALITAGNEAAETELPADSVVPVTPAPASPEVERILDLIPSKIGFRFTGLPEMPELHPDGLYQLSADGKSIVSLKTATVYPNAQYPENKMLTAVNGKGDVLEYPYYEDAEGKKYFLSAHLWYLQKSYTIAQTNTIARTDPLGAARLLYRFAQMYEGFVPTNDDFWNTYPLHASSGPPYAYWGGMWYRWSVAELSSLRPLLLAYGEVKKTDALQVLSQEVGEDVEQMLVEKMFLPSVDYALSFPQFIGNMNPSQWTGLIEAGKVLRRPEYIHYAVEWMREYVDTQYLSDGFWKEITPSYHVQSTSGLNSSIEQLRGYSDPPGYVSPRSGTRFDNLDMYAEFPLIGKSKEVTNLLTFPNGNVLPVQDTWASDKAASPRHDSGSLLLPAAGVGRLSGGEGTGRTQLYLGFTPKYGHTHYDPLNLNLYAQGQELLPDLGYTYTKYRWFTTSTLGHNTVVVDAQNMSAAADRARHGGMIEAFAPVGAFQAMRASEANGYAQTEVYSREPWFVPFPDGSGSEGYVLDLFRVKGGSRHEYTLQGDANRDAEFETALPLSEYGPYLLPPGTQVQEAENYNESGTAQGHYPAYIHVNDVQKAELTGDKYEVTLNTSQNGVQKAGMKITGLLEAGANTLYLARSPSIRSTRLSGKSKDNNDEAVQYDMPKLVHRREGSNLSSTFVTALEPYAAGGGPRIASVERLLLDQAPEGAVAVKITYDDVTEYVLSSPNHPDQPLLVEDMEMRAEMGFIRVRDGVVQNMILVGGTELTKGSRTITAQGPVTGNITATKRKAAGDPYDALVTDTPISPSAAASMKGTYTIVTHPDGSTRGYKIGDIRSEEGKTIIVLAEHDPGFEIAADGSSRMLFLPLKTWTGTHTFSIANVAALDRNPLQAVGLEASQRHLTTGETVNLSVYGLHRDGSLAELAPGKSVFFSSSDPAVVTVDEDGLVTARGEGVAVVTAEARLNGVTKTASLLLSSQHRPRQVYSFVDLQVAEQTAPTLYVPSSNTVQFEANEAGQSIAFMFEVAEDAVYAIGIKPFKAASYGKYRISIDDEELGVYDFYSASSGIGASLETIGTLPLTAGVHRLELVNDGKNVNAGNYKFGMQQLEIQTPLAASPELQAAAGPVYPGQAAELTLADSAAWRQAIAGVSVNGVPLSGGQYAVSPGKVTVAADAFSSGSGAYWIAVQADGYRHAAAEQQIRSAAELGGLVVSPGTLSPPFDPRIREFALLADEDTAAVTVTAQTYRPDAVITVGGHVYGSSASVPLQLQAGENTLPLHVAGADGSSAVYTVTVYRDIREVQQFGTVTGTVYGADGLPLAGASVRIVGRTGLVAVTDALGRYTIADVPTGSWRVAATKLDYLEALSAWGQVEAEQTTVIDMAMQLSPAPLLFDVTYGAAAVGDPVTAAMSRDGMLHLVPEGTAASQTAIEAASVVTVGGTVYGARTAAAAATAAALDTSDFAPGFYVVYAIDGAGNVSEASGTIAVIPRDMAVVDSASPFIRYAGAGVVVNSASLYGGSEWTGRAEGASALVPFYGTQAQVLGTLAANGGLGEIYVDGVYQTTYDFLKRGTAQFQQVVFDTGVLPLGAHTIEIRATGESSPNSQNIWVRFDALLTSGF